MTTELMETDKYEPRSRDQQWPPGGQTGDLLVSHPVHTKLFVYCTDLGRSFVSICPQYVVKMIIKPF